MRYNKDIIIIETTYPHTADENDDLQNIIRSQITGNPTTPEGHENDP